MPAQTRRTIAGLDCTLVKNPDRTPRVAVILCHGFGAPGSDLVPIAGELINLDSRLNDVLFIFPTAPLELDPAFDARAWWLIDMEKLQALMATGQTREMRNESPDRLPECRNLINQIIDDTQSEYQLASDKIVVGGFSQGAMLATDVALHHGSPLGGLIIWSGALIDEAVWSKRVTEQSPLRVVQTHGSLDPILPVSGAVDLRQMLSSGGHDVQYHEFVGPHTIPLEGLQMAGQLLGDTIGSS